MNKNKDFEFYESDIEIYEIPARDGQKITECTSCIKTCHDDCAYGDNEKQHCMVFN